MERPLDDAAALAARWLADSGDRWRHVEVVGTRAEGFARDTELVSSTVIRAAWLYDLGYASALASTGFHPVDGARFLAEHGESDAVVGLVAHHSGAQ